MQVFAHFYFQKSLQFARGKIKSVKQSTHFHNNRMQNYKKSCIIQKKSVPLRAILKNNIKFIYLPYES